MGYAFPRPNGKRTSTFVVHPCRAGLVVGRRLQGFLMTCFATDTCETLANNRTASHILFELEMMAHNAAQTLTISILVSRGADRYRMSTGERKHD